MDVEQLLTTTRSARKSLDLDAGVDIDDIRECRRVGLQADNVSNQQSWRWLVLADAALRRTLAERYRAAYLLRVGGQMLGDLLPAGSPEGRLMSSTEWLVENLANVPLLVIPCYQPYLPRMTVTNPSTRRLCTARSSRRYGTFSWRCMLGVRHLRHHAAPAPRGRRRTAAEDPGRICARLPAASRPSARGPYLPARSQTSVERGCRCRPMERPAVVGPIRAASW